MKMMLLVVAFGMIWVLGCSVAPIPGSDERTGANPTENAADDNGSGGGSQDGVSDCSSCADALKGDFIGFCPSERPKASDLSSCSKTECDYACGDKEPFPYLWSPETEKSCLACLEEHCEPALTQCAGKEEPKPCDRLRCNDALNFDASGWFCESSERLIKGLDSCSAERCQDDCGADAFGSLFDPQTSSACMYCLEDNCQGPVTACSEDR